MTAEKDVQVARKKTFFFREVFPYTLRSVPSSPGRSSFICIGTFYKRERFQKVCPFGKPHHQHILSWTLGGETGWIPLLQL